jgi:hypothetical protein
MPGNQMQVSNLNTLIGRLGNSAYWFTTSFCPFVAETSPSSTPELTNPVHPIVVHHLMSRQAGPHDVQTPSHQKSVGQKSQKSVTEPGTE